MIEYYLVCLTSFQRTVAKSWRKREVRCAPSFYAGTYRTLQDKSDAKTTVSKHPNEDASRSGQGAADAREVEPVRLIPMMMDRAMSAHVPLDATSHESISTLGCEGPYDGARYFHSLTL